MSNKKEIKLEKQEDPVNIRINPATKPTFADEIVEISFDNQTFKMLLAQRYQREMAHTDTIILPLKTIRQLKDMLNAIDFDEILANNLTD